MGADAMNVDAGVMDADAGATDADADVDADAGAMVLISPVMSVLPRAWSLLVEKP
ncbi:hypothetical protein GPA10_13845 [Streptomyces sp. p1417]|uniref:Uncharacterized protein n=1 Tax=Streptomyces typhae TaxID=2681492 RepID=A0A6L6WVX1_9ACTN|nr:hypothetical protein [Streptomyces typhae]MVO85809.1 hypothetical protein [Streptomyces typhae]